MKTALAGPTRHARIVLAPGQPLIHAAAAAMAALAWQSATLLILGGRMDQLSYHTSMLTPDGPRWIDYGPARELPRPAWLVSATATYGSTADGRPALHCHAILAGPTGPVGGHLPPDRCVIGPDGLVAHAISAPDASFRIQRDHATGFDLLTPS